MKTLIRELQNPEKLVEAIRELEKLEETGQWPRDSILLGYAQGYEVRNDVPRTRAIQLVIRVVQQLGYRLVIRLWEEHKHTIDDGK